MDDVSLACSVSGEGPPLLLIMGFGGTMDMWGFPFLSRLMKKFTVISFDHRGMGESSLGIRVPSIERFASDAAGLLDGLGVKKAHVLGWSMGGYVAQELALCRPNLVRRLVLYGTCCDHQTAVSVRREAFDLITDLSVSDRRRTEIALHTLFPDRWLEKRPRFARAFLSHPMTACSKYSDGVAAQVRALESWSGCCSRLRTMDIPTLVVAGEQDRLIPPELARATAAVLRRGRYRPFPDGGHGLVYQYPEELARVVEGFLTAPRGVNFM